jgi:hypothetical protein
VTTLIALGEEAPLKMDLLERSSVEATKLAHQAPVETVVVFVLGVVDHIEIAREEPFPGAYLAISRSSSRNACLRLSVEGS